MHALVLTLALLWLAAAAGSAFAQPPPPTEAEARFDVLEFAVEGNSVLPPIAIERAVYAYLGERKRISDVEAARAALEKVYQESGYPTVLVDIPEQKVDEGTVVLRVNEGRVDRLRITGNRFYSRGYIRSTLPELAEGNVPYFPDAQDQLARLNRNEDRRVAPVLRPGRSPGTVEVELKVEDRFPLHGSLELNNRYSYDTEPLRLLGSLRYDNLWQRDHSASLSYLASPEDTSQVRAFSGTYVVPFVETGRALALYAIKSDSNVATLGDVNVLGKGTIVGARYIVPLPALQRLSHSAIFGVDYKDFEQNVVSGTAFRTPISYTPFVVQYSPSLVTAGGVWQANLAANFSLRGLSDDIVNCGGQQINEFACSRFGASGNYFYLRGDVQHTRALPFASQFFFRVAGQATGSPLISNEQFPIGGAESVRGYTEFEFASDHGVTSQLEVRSRSLLHPDWGVPGELRALAFFDGGWGRIIDPLPSQRASATLTSTGFGVRLRVWKTLVGAFDFAFPLRPNTRDGDRDARLVFRIAYDF